MSYTPPELRWKGKIVLPFSRDDSSLSRSDVFNLN